MTICFHYSICVFSAKSFFIASCLTAASAVFPTQVIAHVFCLILSYFAIFLLVTLRIPWFPTNFLSNPIFSCYIICQFWLIILFPCFLLVVIMSDPLNALNTLYTSPLMSLYFFMLSTLLYQYAAYIGNKFFLECYNNRILDTLFDKK